MRALDRSKLDRKVAARLAPATVILSPRQFRSAGKEHCFRSAAVRRNLSASSMQSRRSLYLVAIILTFFCLELPRSVAVQIPAIVTVRDAEFVYAFVAAPQGIGPDSGVRILAGSIEIAILFDSTGLVKTSGRVGVWWRH
jgi:hypothetical protein